MSRPKGKPVIDFSFRGVGYSAGMLVVFLAKGSRGLDSSRSYAIGATIGFGMALCFRALRARARERAATGQGRAVLFPGVRRGEVIWFISWTISIGVTPFVITAGILQPGWYTVAGVLSVALAARGCVATSRLERCNPRAFARPSADDPPGLLRAKASAFFAGFDQAARRLGRSRQAPR